MLFETKQENLSVMSSVKDYDILIVDTLVQKSRITKFAGDLILIANSTLTES